MRSLRITILSALVALSGCAVDIDTPIRDARQSISDADSKARQISEVAPKIQPKEVADTVGKLATGIQADHAKANEHLDKVSSRADRLETEAAKYDDSWFGGKTWGLIWTLGGLFVAYLIYCALTQHNIFAAAKSVGGLISSVIGFVFRKKTA